MASWAHHFDEPDSSGTELVLRERERERERERKREKERERDGGGQTALAPEQE